MSDRYFVDTNILVYAHDRSAGAKHERARSLVAGLWASREGVLSTQVLQELAVNVRRKATRPLSPEETRDLVADYLSWEIVVNTADSVVEALELESRYRISFWDAMIVRAAQVAGAGTLYSEDLADGQAYGSVRVVNPLRLA